MGIMWNGSCGSELVKWLSIRNLVMVEGSRFQDSRHMKVVRLSALRTGRLYPQEIFLVLLSVRGRVNCGCCNLFCNVWVCKCMGFVMGVCIYGVCNVWVL